MLHGCKLLTQHQEKQYKLWTLQSQRPSAPKWCAVLTAVQCLPESTFSVCSSDSGLDCTASDGEDAPHLSRTWVFPARQVEQREQGHTTKHVCLPTFWIWDTYVFRWEMELWKLPMIFPAKPNRVATCVLFVTVISLCALCCLLKITYSYRSSYCWAGAVHCLVTHNEELQCWIPWEGSHGLHREGPSYSRKAAKFDCPWFDQGMTHIIVILTLRYQV